MGVLEETLKNPGTCLFRRFADTPIKPDEELASIYLYRSPCSFDEYVNEILNHRKKQCGSAQEYELLRFIDEYYYDQLLRVRNSQWAPEIIRALREEPNSYFFAFGAAHFRGEHRIQNYLEAAGFQVDYIGANDRLNEVQETVKMSGFWDWLNFGVGFVWFVYLLCWMFLILIKCSKIESLTNNTIGDDLWVIMRILKCFWGNPPGEIPHFHAD